MPKAIVIGASSGIGRETARVLLREGYVVGLTGRRKELLTDLQKEYPTTAYVKQLDVSKPDEATVLVASLIREMGGMDLIIINAGVGFHNPDFEWEKDKQTIAVNVEGFSAMANLAAGYFSKQRSGHIVGISSIAALRGSPACCYSASKAFVSNYLEGLRKLFYKQKKPIFVTDIQPGFVDTFMAKGPGVFWASPASKAAQQIVNRIKSKRKHAYISKRWRLIAWVLKLLPDWLYNRL